MSTKIAGEVELIVEACPVAGCRRSAARLVCSLHAALVPYDLKRRELVAWMRWQRAFQKHESLYDERVQLAGLAWRSVREEVLRDIHLRMAQILPFGRYE